MTPETVRLSMRMLRRDKVALQRLAEAEGEVMAVVLRRLIRQAAQERGLWLADEDVLLVEVDGEADDDQTAAPQRREGGL